MKPSIRSNAVLMAINLVRVLKDGEILLSDLCREMALASNNEMPHREGGMRGSEK